ncbi:Serpin domain containing protein, partial [Asbolus verrucosus]
IFQEMLKNNPNNFLLSPLSAEIALAFAQSGCKGETAREIRTALSLPDNSEKVESAVKDVLSNLTANEFYALHTANKMYVKANFAIKDEFKRAAVEVYQADSENIDFTKNVEAAKTMNQWVEKRTDNKIRDLVDSGDLDELTRVVLINALHFKANWSTPFLRQSTRKRKFYKTSKDVVEIDTMNEYGGRYKYFECPHLNAKLLELPFEGGEASMTIILPNEKEGLAAIENQIEKAFVPHDLTTKLVNVALPKFKIGNRVDFKQILKNLGVHSAFDEKKADLSGIAGDKGDLKINEVKQKTFMEVNEDGVEAAAATYVGLWLMLECSILY